MSSLFLGGIICPFSMDQMISYGFRIMEQHEDIVLLTRDPDAPLVPSLSPPDSFCMTWNLDHYPATWEGTRQLNHDLQEWHVSDHDRMVLLWTHQERAGAKRPHTPLPRRHSVPTPLSTGANTTSQWGHVTHTRFI